MFLLFKAVQTAAALSLPSQSIHLPMTVTPIIWDHQLRHNFSSRHSFQYFACYDHRMDDVEDDPEVWTANLFRIMQITMQNQIKDLRSGITMEVMVLLLSMLRRVCLSTWSLSPLLVLHFFTAFFFQQVKWVMIAMAKAGGDAVGPFFLNQLPTILECVNSGNKVIFGHMDEAMCTVIPLVRIKKFLLTLNKTAREHKSVQLREFCAKYILLALGNWGKAFLSKDKEDLAETIKKMLSDASPNVRTHARGAFFEYQAVFPEEGDELMRRLDSRTQKFLGQFQAEGGSVSGSLGKSAGRSAPKSFSVAPGAAEKRAPPPAPAARTGLTPTASSKNSASGGSPRMLGSSDKRSPQAAKSAAAAPQPELLASFEEGNEDEPSLPAVGSQVRADVREGTFIGRVRFAGETAFASGVWLGLELDSPDGKNDGAVGGQRYFNCAKNYGLFVRPNQVSAHSGGDPLPPPPPSASSRSGSSASGGSDWQGMGNALLLEHKKHIDAVLSQLREEMELLADFERMQDRLTVERVKSYNEAMRACVEHRDELSSEFQAAAMAAYDKHGIPHKHLSLS